MSEAVTEEVEMDELFRKMRKMNSPVCLSNENVSKRAPKK